MQFIERLFGLYPDAGNGVLELSLLAVVLSALAFRVAINRPFAWRQIRTQKSRK